MDFCCEIMQKNPLSAAPYYDHNIEKESGYEMVIDHRETGLAATVSFAVQLWNENVLETTVCNES